MNLELPSQLGFVIFAASLLGAIGGLAFDVASPLQRKEGSRADDFDNKLSLPSVHERELMLGFLGPMFVGAVAAVTALFAIAVTADESGTSATVPVQSLIWISLAAGFGGSLVLEALRTLVIDLIKGRKDALTTRALDAAAKSAGDRMRGELPALIDRACEDRAERQRVSDEAASRVTAAVTEAITERIGSGAAPTQAWVRGLAIFIVLLVLLVGTFLAGRAAEADQANAIAPAGRPEQVAGEPPLTVEPDELDFGQQQSGEGAVSTVQFITVTSSSSSPVNLGAPLIEPPDSGFAIRRSTCNRPLEPQESCRIRVGFTPTSTGPVSAVLKIAAEDGSVELPVALQAVGLAEPIRVDIALTCESAGERGDTFFCTISNQDDTAATGLTLAASATGLALDVGTSDPEDFVCQAETATLQCELSSLAPFETATVEFFGKPSEARWSVALVVDAYEDDPDPGDNSETLEQATPATTSAPPTTPVEDIPG